MQPAIVRLTGEFDAFNSAELRRLLAGVQDARQVVIDFTQTRYIDSSCLTELANLRRMRAAHELPAARIVMPGKNLRRIFKIVGFDTVFPVFDTMQQALESVAT